MLLIRADADTRMGTGHVMRCLALAQAWQDAGGRVTFLSAALPPGLEARLGAEGMRVVTLAADAGQTARTAQELGADWVVLDGYQFDTGYQKALKDAGARLLVLDDNGEAGTYHADLVLNQNVHARAEWYESRAPHTRLLLGTRYALLRREFRVWRDSPRETPEVVRRILVTLGGSDPDNVTLKVLDALALIRREGLEATVVIGGGNPHRAGLEDAAARMPFPVRVVVNAADMPELMAWADVAVSAGGSTVWELAFLGVPSLLLVTAENQLGVAEGMRVRGATHSLGWAGEQTALSLASSLTALLDDPARRSKMSRQARALVDGRGAERVLRTLREEPLRLRRATPDDCRRVWEWANDPAVRASAFSSEAIGWEEHRRWFSEKLQDPDCFFFIALDGREEPVGQIRFDIVTPEDGVRHAEVDVSVDATRRGQGLGAVLIRAGVGELSRLALLEVILAHAKTENLGSRQAFAAAGFSETGLVRIKGYEAVSLRCETEYVPA